MARALDATTVSELQTPEIRPVLLVRLDITTDPLIAWTGPGTFAPSSSGDTQLDGQVFTPVAPIIDLSKITEDQGIGGAVTLKVSGHDLDEDLLQQIVKDKRQWRGNKAWLWLGLLAADQASVLDHPFRIKTGVITNIITNRTGANSIVSVTIDRDLGNARSAPFRIIDHPRFWPLDTFGTFVTALANKPGGLQTTDPFGHPFDTGGFGEEGGLGRFEEIR